MVSTLECCGSLSVTAAADPPVREILDAGILGFLQGFLGTGVGGASGLHPQCLGGTSALSHARGIELMLSGCQIPSISAHTLTHTHTHTHSHSHTDPLSLNISVCVS